MKITKIVILIFILKMYWVIEGDITGCFDHIQHKTLMRLLKRRVQDKKLTGVIWQMLQAGIMEGELFKKTKEGTPQGSILSPLLSNIYLHYVLDLWFSRRVRRQSRGETEYFRFADDFLACFQYKEDAEQFLQRLRDRIEGFGLKLAEDKTQCIEFGRYARGEAQQRGEKPKDFTFLGFTHYCGKTKSGYFKVKRRTSRKKLGLSLRKFTEWAIKARNVQRKGEMIRSARIRVIGHLNYYAITDNADRCNTYVHHATNILFKWLNRKSQRKAYTWDQYKQALAWADWPTVTIRKDLNPCRRAGAH